MPSFNRVLTVTAMTLGGVLVGFFVLRTFAPEQVKSLFRV